MICRSEDSLPAFKEMFTHGAPRFISPNPPPYETESMDALDFYSSLPDASSHQLDLFISSVEPQLSTSTLRSFLRLYTTLGTDKLAGFLKVDEEQVLEMLMVAKGAARKFTWVQGGLLEGEVVGVSDINFGIDEVSPQFPILLLARCTDAHGVQTHVTVAESKTSRRYGDFFLRHGLKFRDVYDSLKAKPLRTSSLPSLQRSIANASDDSAVPKTRNGAASSALPSLAAGGAPGAADKAVWGSGVKA